ncbi:MAG: hypothetical protein NZ822_03100 [Patescibacteria group bacterium]|nr:hypothetical protein [Patescibacteria group bacterium]
MAKVFLGDQSPWGRGLLRALALQRAGVDFCYAIHDLDCPWVGVGSHKIFIKRTNVWPAYASIKSIRVGSYTSQGEIGFDALKIFHRLRPPSGFAYLAGPSNVPTTILSVSASSFSKDFMSCFREMLKEEIDFYHRLGGSWHNFFELSQILKETTSPIDFSYRVAHLIGLDTNKIIRLSDFFREHQDFLILRSLEGVRLEDLWALDEVGNRFPAHKRQDLNFLFPKGKLLPRVLLSLGYHVGATNLPYSDYQVEISLKWRWALDFIMPLKEFWRSYPTALACLIISPAAGELKAEIKFPDKTVEVVL